MFGLSPQHTKYLRSLKCPLCGRFVFGATARLADGRKVRSLERAYLMRNGRTAVVRCPKCNGEWPVFAKGSAPVVPGAVGIRIKETGRVEEPFLDDAREFDNRGGTTATTQTISVAEQWNQTVQLGHEGTRTTQSGATVGASQLASLTTQVEETLRTNYSVTESHQRTFTDSLTIEVPARTRRRIELHFRRTLQTGLAEASMADGSVLEVPFRVALNLSLDWSQNDEVVSA